MRAKTDMLDVASRKLAPYVLLFGCYLISHGNLSPGGGFQGGVVLASGLLLPALGCLRERMAELMSNYALSLWELLGFLLFFLLGITGVLTVGTFLGDPFSQSSGSNVTFIFILNIVIGLKVGAGIGLLCLMIIRRSQEEEKEDA